MNLDYGCRAQNIYNRILCMTGLTIRGVEGYVFSHMVKNRRGTIDTWYTKASVINVTSAKTYNPIPRGKGRIYETQFKGFVQGCWIRLWLNYLQCQSRTLWFIHTRNYWLKDNLSLWKIDVWLAYLTVSLIDMFDQIFKIIYYRFQC